MTRRSKRELERALEDLTSTGTEGVPPIEVLYRDGRTGDLVDADGEPANPDPGADTIILNDVVVMDRERAEEEGHEILGPAEDAPEGRDTVRVAWGGR